MNIIVGIALIVLYFIVNDNDDDDDPGTGVLSDYTKKIKGVLTA